MTMISRLASGRLLPLMILTAAIILSFLAGRQDIMTMTFPDPDDALRLQQVRDLLNGQAWFDVMQHRVNPPAGGLMHWSRLIDLPLAAMIVALTPLLGPGNAEFLAVLFYSVAMMALLMFVMARVLRLYDDPMLVVAGLAALLLMPLVGAQFRLTRIDHHSAQMLLGAAAFGLAIADWRRWSGAIAGLLLAISVSISLEAIIYVPAFGLVFAWPWLMRGEARDMLAGFCLSFVLASLGVMIATRGPGAPLQSYCDAMSRPYLAATAAATLVFLAGTCITLPAAARWTVAALAGGAALAALGLADAQCLNGPFASLDPFTREYWYNSVLEGLPIWKQGAFALHLIALHLIALTGLLWGWRESSSAAARRRWSLSLFLFVWAMCVGLMVMRSNGIAYLFGLGGIALVSGKAWMKARAMTSAPLRIAATIANPLLVAALLPLATNATAVSGSSAASAPSIAIDSKMICSNRYDAAGLRTVSPGLIFAQIDSGPMILLETPHSVMASGHHRNDHAIGKVIQAFLASPERARAIIASTGATYLSFCPTSNEGKAYLAEGRGNLAHALAGGHPPPWLRPVAMPAGASLQLYRIVRADTPPLQ